MKIIMLILALVLSLTTACAPAKTVQEVDAPAIPTVTPEVVDESKEPVDYYIPMEKEYRLQERLRELEEILPSYFIRINKSTLANEHRIDRFVAVFSGGVDAVFQCGWREYVSRRCFSEIKRRYEGR